MAQLSRGDGYAYAFENAATIRAALDRVHVKPGTAIAGGARSGLLPADDGGASAWIMPAVVRVQRATFDAGAEQAALVGKRTDLGGGGRFYRVLPRRRRRVGSAGDRALSRHGGSRNRPCGRAGGKAAGPLKSVLVIHRYGRIEPGEPIVLVITLSLHRREAFEAAAFLMDYLKTRAPFWKKQHLANQSAADWVGAKASDDAAADQLEGRQGLSAFADRLQK